MEDWKFSMREVCEFSTVEDFWKYWSFFPRPSEILFDGHTRKEVEGRTIDAFSVFKKGIKPEWEDPVNRSGGELTCRKTINAEALDVYWENMVLGLIGETIDEGDEICGCRVVDKSKRNTTRTIFRLELWTRTSNEDVANQLKVRLIDVLSEGDRGKGKGLEFEFKKRDGK